MGSGCVRGAVLLWSDLEIHVTCGAYIHDIIEDRSRFFFFKKTQNCHRVVLLFLLYFVHLSTCMYVCMCTCRHVMKV